MKESGFAGLSAFGFSVLAVESRERSESLEDGCLRYTQSGKAVANFTLAVSHRSKSSGQWQDVTDGFFSVTCWNSLADNVAQSLKKGSRVVVTGKLSQRTFEVEGNKRNVVEVVASRVAVDLQFTSATVAKSPADVKIAS